MFPHPPPEFSTRLANIVHRTCARCPIDNSGGPTVAEIAQIKHSPGSIYDFEQFVRELNNNSLGLRFTHTCDLNSITFLDLVIVKDGKGKIQTLTHRKPTATNSLLKWDSHHPLPLRRGIPKGQFLRIRRNCSREDDFENQAVDLFDRFLERGYPRRILQQSYAYAQTLSNQISNHESKKEDPPSPKIPPKEIASTPETALLALNLCYDASNPEEHSFDTSSKLDPGAECERTSMNLMGQQKDLTTEKLFLCTDCGKCFALKADLIQHWRIHMKEKPFQCCECGECFTSKMNCAKHFRIHRGKTPFQCSECGKCFIKKSTYCNHQRVHTGGPQYQCSKCSKTFAHKCSLVKHKRTHGGERAFSCSECGKRFSEKCDFVRHLRIHTGEKPYSCTECGKGFTQKSNLVRHQKTHMI
ncbi:uncharacterized protein ACNLHF_027055 [Anomaloglossus baeobatrachus]